VNGRKIKDITMDDAYNPAQTVPDVHKLVEQDHVFAIVGSLGTAPGLATWGYLNQNKVPQVLLATGDSYWGFSFKKYPWTTGWQPDYPGEGKLYGRYIAKNMPSARIGVLYQNDAFGKNYYAGLRVGLGKKKEAVVDAESYDATATSFTQQILAMKSKGADTFVIFATPSPTITSLVTAAKVGWTPKATFVGNVSANRLFMLAAAKAGANLDNVISTSYVASSTTQKSLPGVQLASQIIDQYAPSLKPSFDAGDANVMYGFGVAWTFVYALQHAGKTPTRAGLMKALHNMSTAKNPFVYPGIKLQTALTKKKHDNFPIEQEILIRWSGGASGDWAPFGSLYDHVR
jgi:branched-chain amino acid transport system substrate-binding protein